MATGTRGTRCDAVSPTSAALAALVGANASAARRRFAAHRAKVTALQATVSGTTASAQRQAHTAFDVRAPCCSTPVRFTWGPL